MCVAIADTGMEAYHYTTLGNGRQLLNNFYIPSQKVVIRRAAPSVFQLLEDPATLAEAKKIVDERQYGRLVTLDTELAEKLVSSGRAMNQAESQLQESKDNFEKNSKTLVELALAAGKKSG